MTEVEKKLERRFESGNSVLVERTFITRDEWHELCTELLRLRVDNRYQRERRYAARETILKMAEEKRQ